MFENLCINKKCAEKLEYAVAASRLSHAVILEGADEVTRLAAAKELAKAIVCTGNGKPCEVCPSCKKANSGNHPDIHILQKDEKASTIRVDEIRALKEQATLLPNDGEKCVFIIAEAQTMGIQAQNALLKIFEEPSAFVNFILTCPSKSAFLETIVSRGSVYRLSNEEETLKDDEKSRIAGENAAALLECLCAGNEFEFLKATADFQKDKDALSLVLEVMIPIIRDALILSGGSDRLMSGYAETARKLSARFAPDKLMRFIELAMQLKAQLLASANYNLLLTRFSSAFYQIKNS